MDTYSLARLFGVFSLIVCLGRLFNLDHMKLVVKEVQHSAIGRGVMGWMPLFFGLFIMLGNEDFASQPISGWHLVLFVYAALLVLLGILRLWFIQRWVKFFQSYADFIPVLNCLFGLIFGFLLIYIGFLVPLHPAL
jgi:hypothetical protein